MYRLFSANLCRYELPGIRALNFVLRDSLGGGGVASIRIDPQVYTIIMSSYYIHYIENPYTLYRRTSFNIQYYIFFTLLNNVN